MERCETQIIFTTGWNRCLSYVCMILSGGENAKEGRWSDGGRVFPLVLGCLRKEREETFFPFLKFKVILGGKEIFYFPLFNLKNLLLALSHRFEGGGLRLRELEWWELFFPSLPFLSQIASWMIACTLHNSISRFCWMFRLERLKHFCIFHILLILALCFMQLTKAPLQHAASFRCSFFEFQPSSIYSS